MPGNNLTVTMLTADVGSKGFLKTSFRFYCVASKRYSSDDSRNAQKDPRALPHPNGPLSSGPSHLPCSSLFSLHFKDELKKYPKRVHEVLGGDITADPLPLSDDDYLTIYEKSYR